MMIVQDWFRYGHSMERVKTAVDHLRANGVIDPELLYRQPFTAVHDQGPDGLFGDEEANELFAVIQAVNLVVR